jgi:hypothetical protein
MSISCSRSEAVSTSLSQCVLLCGGDDERRTTVKEKDDSGWSSDDVVVGMRQNRDTVD